MIADGVRTQAYANAMRHKIKQQSVVLDIGTGIGVFAVLACQYGASRVYAIEPDDAIQVAREIAIANGVGDRVEFIQDLSTKTTLPEKVDVIVSDLHGVLPLFGNHIPSIEDARNRFLAPGGQLIPQSDTLWVALVEAPELYERHVQNPNGVVEVDFTAARRIVINTWRKGRIEPNQLLVEPQCWATLDYTTIKDPDVRGQATWTIKHSGTCHGLVLWFDSVLADGIAFSNAPGKPELIYGAGFFPWPDPVTLDVNDTIEVILQADLVGNDYVWRWSARIAGLKDRHIDFKQSTLQGNPFSLETLKRRSHSHIPELDEDVEIDRFILSLIDGTTSQGDLARRVVERFPNRFAKWEEALTWLAELSQRYVR